MSTSVETSRDDKKQKTITIIVNAQPKTTEDKKLSYEDVVAFAFNPVPTGPNVVISVDYENGPKQNVEGILRPGKSVHLQDGMIFDVTATDKS